jgi:hypothetical protein
MNRRRLLVTTGAMVLIVSASGAAAAANLGLLNQGAGDPAPGIGQLELQVQPAGAGRRPTGESAIVVTLPPSTLAASQAATTEGLVAPADSAAAPESEVTEPADDSSPPAAQVLPASTKRPTTIAKSAPTTEQGTAGPTSIHRDPRHHQTTLPPGHGGGPGEDD